MEPELHNSEILYCFQHSWLIIRFIDLYQYSDDNTYIIINPQCCKLKSFMSLLSQAQLFGLGFAMRVKIKICKYQGLRYQKTFKPSACTVFGPQAPVVRCLDTRFSRLFVVSPPDKTPGLGNSSHVEAWEAPRNGGPVPPMKHDIRSFSAINLHKPCPFQGAFGSWRLLLVRPWQLPRTAAVWEGRRLYVAQGCRPPQTDRLNVLAR